MAVPMMPKATAVWLIDNTALTFQQIADFCGLHELEVQAIADGEVVSGMTGMDPIANGQLSQEEIKRCEADRSARLELLRSNIPEPTARTKGARYTPIAKRQDKPDGIAWLLRNHPELSDAQIGRLLGTTKNTINAVRDRSHWNSQNIRPRDPVEIGLCNYIDLQNAVEKARKRMKSGDDAATSETQEAAAKGEAAYQEPEKAPEEEKPEEKSIDSLADISKVFGDSTTKNE